MYLIEHALGIGLLLGGLRAEGIEKALVLAGRHETTLDTELVHQADETEAVHQHADAAHDAGLVNKDAVGGGSDVVGRRGTGVLDDGVHRLFMLFLQATDFVIDHARMHGAAAGRVDQKHHALRADVFEGGAQGRHQELGAGFLTRTDLAANLDHRRVRMRLVGVRRPIRPVALENEPSHRDQESQPGHTEGAAPDARLPLLLEGGEHEALERVALPVGTAFGCVRLRGRRLARWGVVDHGRV